MTRSHPRIPFIEFESSGEPMLPLAKFWGRLLRGGLLGSAMIVGSLLIGVIGYHCLDRLGWVDSILNASMILGGMGPIKELPNDAAKIFASVYALFSGLLLIAMMGIILAPVIHRVMHKFHVDEKDVK